MVGGPFSKGLDQHLSIRRPTQSDGVKSFGLRCEPYVRVVELHLRQLIRRDLLDLRRWALPENAPRVRALDCFGIDVTLLSLRVDFIERPFSLLVPCQLLGSH